MTRNLPNDGNSEAAPPATPVPDSPLEAFEETSDAWIGLVRDAERPRTGGRLGDYEILSEIGRGGQGLVFRARQPATGREIALKRLSAGAFSSQAARRRFEREVEVVASLTHPGIVTVHGFEFVDGVPILAMEWVDGEPLTGWSARTTQELGAGRERIRSLLTLFLQVCAAVQHAHGKGVIHRDLKPSNILVDRSDRCRLLDFGLARKLWTEDAEDTRTVGFVGTPAYAAPEFFTDETLPLDVRSDVYSLGILLYECLTGQRPFQATGWRELLAQVESGDPAPPSDKARDVDRELDLLVRKACAREPGERYQTVHALAEDVQRYLDGRPVLAVPPTTSYALVKWMRRNRLAFTFSLALLISILASTVLGFWQASVIAAERNEAWLQGQAAERARREASTAQSRAEEKADEAEAARDELQEALELARAEAQKARSVQDFYLDAIYVAATPLSEVGSTDVVDVLAYAASTARAHFVEHPEVAVEILSQVARTMVFNRRLDEAQALADEALSLQDTLAEPALGTRADLFKTRAEILAFRGREADALPELERSAEIYASLGDPPPLPKSYASTLFSLGVIQHRLGQVEAALASLRHSESLSASAGDLKALALVRSHLSEVLIVRGETAEAEALLRSTLERVEAELDPESIVVGEVCSFLSNLLWKRAEHAEALALQERAIPIFKKHYGEEDPRLAWELFYLGRGLRDVGRCDEALEVFAAVTTRATEPRASAHALRGRAECTARTGDLDVALGLYREARAAYARSLPTTDATRVELLIDWLALLIESERWEAAEELFPNVRYEMLVCAENGGVMRARYWDLWREISTQMAREDEVDALRAQVGQ